MRIFITGGTGFVGTHLTQRLAAQGHEILLLTRALRDEHPLPPGASMVHGDPGRPGAWQERVADCDVAINLAGASIFTPWTAHAKQVIRDSRILTTRHLTEALAGRRGRETVLVSASAVGYYGGREDDVLLEEDSPPGSDFLALLAQDWESEAQRAADFGVRVVCCRFGIVLGRGGGALAKMVPAFKRWLGGVLGSGKQWFSWVHEQDLAEIILFALDRQTLGGAVNCAAPFPVRNREMTRILAKALHRSVLVPPAPAFMVRMILGEFGDVLLKGQRVIPRRLLSEGFVFRFPTMEEALSDLLP
jgi:hypothetical protein